MLISNLSHSALENMGFQPIPDGEILEAHFKSISVYEIRGIISDNASPLDPKQLLHVENDFSFSIGNDVNTVCQTLAGEDFTQDAEEWRKEKKATPPFLMILIQLREATTCEYGYWKFEDEKILTYNCFPKARKDLKELTEKNTSKLTTSLAIALSSNNNPVVFIPLQSAVFAETNHQKILNDTCLVNSMEVTPCKLLSIDTFNAEIENALSLYSDLNEKIGYFFDLAVRADDTLKKFIYYFLVIEIHTHQTFKALDYDSHISHMNEIPERIKSSTVDFLISQYKQSKTLSQRFIWCSILKWNTIDDEDIQRFKVIKKFRDQIYHGEKIPENVLPINQAQQLALKLLNSR